MAIIVTDNKKVYEKPESGAYNAVLVDTVDLGIVATTNYGNKAKVRFVWLLGKVDGSGFACDSEGNPFQVMSQVNATMNEGGNLFKLIRSIIGAAPAAGPYDIETLIGRNNQLFIVREASADGKDVYANVKGILPYPANLAPLGIPEGYVRFKNREKKQYAQSGQQQQVAPAQAAAPVGSAPAPISLDKPF